MKFSLPGFMNKTTGARQPDAATKRHGRTIRTLALPLLFTGMITLLVVAALSYLQFALVGKERTAAVTQRDAAGIAATLAGRVQGYTDIIATIGNSSTIVDAMATRNQLALNEWATRLRQQFPAVLRVQFIASGTGAVDETQSPPLSYACLELVHEAERGQLPLVEAHMYGTQVQHVDLLRPVTGPQGIIGSVLVTLDVAILHDWLEPLLPKAGGYLELRQGVEDKFLLLGGVGDAALQSGAATASLPVAGTAWMLDYWAPADTAALAMGEQIAFATVFGIALAVLLGAFGIFTTVIGHVVHRDLEAVAKQVGEMWSGRHLHNFDAHLTESLEVLNAVEEQMHGIQARVAQPDPAKVAALREKITTVAGDSHSAIVFGSQAPDTEHKN